MNSLDDLMGAESSPVQLNDIVGSQLPTITLPQSAVRNRAATIALSSDPEKALDNYQTMVVEGQDGKQDYTNYMQSQIMSKQIEDDKAAFMSVLSDPKIPMDRKKALISEMSKTPMLKDTGMSFYTKAAAQPSYGESRDSEDARINATETSVAQVYKGRNEVQQLVNQYGAGLRDSGAETFGEMAMLFMLPFGNNIAAMREKAGEGGTLKENLKALFLPGNSVKERREKIASFSPADQVEVVRNVLENLSKSSGVIMSDNDFQEFQRAQQLISEGGYTSVDQWLDNLSGLLDIVGMGMLLRAPRKALTPLKAPTGTVPPTSPVKAPVEAVEAIQEPSMGYSLDIRPRTFEETYRDVGGQYSGKISELEAKKASLLGEAGNVADKGAVARMDSELKVLNSKLEDSSEGAVKALAKELQKTQKLSFKEATKEATKQITDRNADIQGQITRLESQLEINRKASTVSQQIDSIDKEIASIRNSATFPSRKTPLADMISRIQGNAPVRTPNPLSPHETLKQANPQKARDSFETIVKGDDAVAEGLTGLNKAEAVANDVYPQAVTASGRVTAQPTDIQRNLRRSTIPELMQDFISNMGRIDYTAAEKATVRAHMWRDFSSAEGLHMHDTMGGFRSGAEVKGGNIEISAVYGTPEGAWSNANDAITQAKFALRKYGLRDDELELLKKDGLDYVPVKLEDAQESGSYMVRVKTTHEIDPTQVVDDAGNLTFDPVTTKRNWADRLPILGKVQGGAARLFADPASMLDPRISASASTVSDLTSKAEKILLDEAAKYSDLYGQLPKNAKERVNNYILEANAKELALDVADLVRRGMSQEEYEALKAWRNFWDGHHYLENLDITRSLNANGYELFKNANIELFVKASAKNQNIGNVYDPATDSIRLLTVKEMDDLYNQGGTYAKLRRPQTIQGEVVTHMIVRNSPTEYTRKFRDTDNVLNYREGYYTRNYTAARFVDEISVDVNGNEVRKAVAVAKDTPEAEAFAKRMRANAGAGVRYETRADDRGLRRGTDDWFDVESAQGRIAQRHRGKLLESGAGINHLGDGSYILDPVSSAINAARSIAGRTVNRPMLETAKARLTKQFGHLFKSDGMGGIKWPSSVDEIGAKGAALTKEVSDARTNWHYINYLENGIINGMDEFIKQSLMAGAEGMGKLGLGRTERAMNIASDVSLTGFGKGAVFGTMIVANPLRQWIVQTHQVTRTFAYNPKAWLTGNMNRLISSYPASLMGIKVSPEQEEFVKFVKGSGMLDAVDKQNLVRGTLLDAAEAKNMVTRPIHKAGEGLRKVGFDLGEQFNLLGHLAAVFDRYKRAGKDLSNVDVAAEAHAEARAISYEMNFAGDMTYNQNSAALLLQFMQIPHKAVLQMTNRKIPKNLRMRMAAADVAIWGVPGSLALSEMLGGDVLPNDPVWRRAITEGLESLMFNWSLQQITGKDIDIDISSVAPYDLGGWSEMVAAMLTGGPEKMLLESPAGQMFFNEHARIPQAVGAISRFFGFTEPIGQTPDDLAYVMTEVAKISSGFTNAQKAYYMLEVQKKFDKYGRPVGELNHQIEAWAQLFGFGSSSTKNLFNASKAISEHSKEYKDEVLATYKTVLMYYQSQMQQGIQDHKQMTAVSSFLLSKYAHSPVAQQIIVQQLGNDLKDPNLRLIEGILRAVNVEGSSVLKDRIRKSPLSEEDKQKSLDALDIAEKAIQEHKQMKE